MYTNFVYIRIQALYTCILKTKKPRKKKTCIQSLYTTYTNFVYVVQTYKNTEKMNRKTKKKPTGKPKKNQQRTEKMNRCHVALPHRAAQPSPSPIAPRAQSRAGGAN